MLAIRLDAEVLAMMTLYDYLDSGNGYKIRLLLAQLGQPYRWIERDTLPTAEAGTRCSLR